MNTRKSEQTLHALLILSGSLAVRVSSGPLCWRVVHAPCFLRRPRWPSKRHCSPRCCLVSVRHPPLFCLWFKAIVLFLFFL
jgi:hypothetical protein